MEKMSEKKAALVMREFSTRSGGGERFACALARGLLEKGIPLEVWAGSFESGLGLEGAFRKISYMRKPSSWKVWSFCNGYRRLARERKVDVVFGLTQVYPVDVYRVGGGIYPQWLRIQYPNRMRRFIHFLIRPVHWANLMIERRILTNRRLKKVVVNSRMEKENLLCYYRIPEERIEVIYNGVDLDRFRPVRETERVAVRREMNTRAGDFVLLFPSNNFRRKGLAVLIAALARLNRKDVTLWVAGRGREAPFKALAGKLQVEERVRFLGKRSDMERLYGASDLMVLPTRYDSFSNVVLEAMACDLPVITTRSNGAAEAVQAGVNGYVLDDPGDSSGLAGLIRKVMRQRNAWKGKPRARAGDFSIGECVSAYARLFTLLTAL